jgi:hypothetical protein
LSTRSPLPSISPQGGRLCTFGKISETCLGSLTSMGDMDSESTVAASASCPEERSLFGDGCDSASASPSVSLLESDKTSLFLERGATTPHESVRQPNGARQTNLVLMFLPCNRCAACSLPDAVRVKRSKAAENLFSFGPRHHQRCHILAGRPALSTTKSKLIVTLYNAK